MRIVVYGAGAVGGVLAARLHLAGVDVQAVARGPHLDAIRARGLRLVTPHGEDVVPLRAAASLADLDLDPDTAVVVTVKSHQTAAVMRDVALHTSPEVTLVSGQNGVANEETLQRTRRHVLGMVVMMPTSHLEPGVVIQASSNVPGLLDVGCFPEGTDERAERVAAALRAGGFESVVRPDIMAWKHRKLLLNLGNAAQAACPPDDDRDRLTELARGEGERVLAAAQVRSSPRRRTTRAGATCSTPGRCGPAAAAPPGRACGAGPATSRPTTSTARSRCSAAVTAYPPPSTTSCATCPGGWPPRARSRAACPPPTC